MSEAGLHALLRRDGYVVVAALVAQALLAWSYLVWLSGQMAMAGMPMDNMSGMNMAMTMAPAVTPTDFLLAFIMWTVMMVGMMTPSVAPVILLYERVGRHAALNGKSFAATGWFAGGYFLAWTVFSALAAAAQLGLHGAALLTPELKSASPVLGGVLLIIAGIYQWSPLKNSCLSQCRAPLLFIQRHGGFKADAADSTALGFRHGLYCTGCCWAFMLLLFVGGVMNLLWVAGLALLVLVEKFSAHDRVFSRLTGLLLAGAGLLLIAAA
jgi:predicted metal-binding membrane protein